VAAPAADPLVPRNGFSEWFERCFGALGRSWRSLLPLYLVTLPLNLIAAVALIPVASEDTLATLESEGRLDMDTGELIRRLTLFAVSLLLGAVVSTVVKGASAWIITHEAAGQPTDWRDAVRFGLRRFWSFVGWSVATGVVTAFGFLACLAPGIWLAVVFGSVLTGVVAFERGDTWGRCFALTKGAWWKLLGRLLVIALLGGVVGGVVGGVSGALVTSDAAVAQIGATLVNNVLSIPIGMLGAAVAVVTYAERRGATDGATTEQLLADIRR
jgi:hypothetical protein